MASTTRSGRFNFSPKMRDLFSASTSSSSMWAASSEVNVSSTVVAAIDRQKTVRAYADEIHVVIIIRTYCHWAGRINIHGGVLTPTLTVEFLKYLYSSPVPGSPSAK